MPHAKRRNTRGKRWPRRIARAWGSSFRTGCSGRVTRKKRAPKTPAPTRSAAMLAARVGADGVHLGEDDPSIVSARELIGPDRIIGVSCYGDFERARAAVEEGADYVAFGSFFASSTKPAARRASVDLLQRARVLG